MNRCLNSPSRAALSSCCRKPPSRAAIARRRYKVPLRGPQMYADATSYYHNLPLQATATKQLLS
eukprot:CAMPEP_0194347910 /NCGR_PEP_ID=MMETSP0171-20130528/106248_1 /TAXON_ID=218684 /ORGANISM="Corethron pennatum, Strain L29A3" /LENGTH=63 /DNA_ID=CAMNT_0039115209 /DNA_START=836 /DNA_END=1024 /DNA_ORIENTATION=-